MYCMDLYVPLMDLLIFFCPEWIFKNLTQFIGELCSTLSRLETTDAPEGHLSCCLAAETKPIAG